MCYGCLSYYWWSIISCQNQKKVPQFLLFLTFSREIAVLRERVNMILETGANVILSTMGIDDLA